MRGIRESAGRKPHVVLELSLASDVLAREGWSRTRGNPIGKSEHAGA
jgi:hypothetical protein